MSFFLGIRNILTYYSLPQTPGTSLKFTGSGPHGDFSHPNICCWGSTAGHKQLERFLECIDGNFLTQVIEEPMREDALLDLIVTNQEELYGEVKTGGSFGCSDHERVEFRMLRRGKKAKSVSQALTSGEQTSACSGIYLEESSGKPWTEEGSRKAD